MGDRCYRDEMGACCCNCAHHEPTMSHPLTDGGRVTEPNGWACLAPELLGVYANWSRHGMCECWEQGVTADTHLRRARNARRGVDAIRIRAVALPRGANR